MKRHKHADLIHAWAEGAEIQIKWMNNLWIDVTGPSFNENETYRIKPEKKPDVVVSGKMIINDDGFPSFYGWGFSQSNLDNLRITFSGETREPIKAEVL